MRPPIWFVALLAFGILYGIVISPIPGLWKFALGILEMYVTGQILITHYGLSGEHGLIMLRSQKGISLIHRIAKNSALWKFLSDTGIVMSYGLLSLVLMRQHVSGKSLVTGIVLLAAMFFFVTPASVAFLAQILDFSLLERSGEQLGTLNPILSISIAVVFLGGYFLLLLLSLLAWGGVVLVALLSTLLEGTRAISETAPGGTLLLPGINLPFFEGILALLIILIVHEGAHAVLARIARIPILSSGLVLFGVIPIGAFVEPDEEKLTRLEAVPQTRVLAAGSTANFLTSIAAFIVFLVVATAADALGLIGTAVIRFVLLVLGLTFALNFVVGTVNLLPLPLFDGYRTLGVNIPSKPVLHFVTALTVVAFLLNFVPWLFI